jgi:diamine N-acetyltransferase
MDITVRRAAAGDYAALSELFDEIDGLHRARLPHVFREPGAAARQEHFAALMLDESTPLWVAEAGGELVGFVQAIVRDAPDMPVLVPRRYAIVDSIAVKAGYQGRGIGRLLMDTAQEWAAANGATSVELNVYEFNETAIAFYERLGYRSLSRKMSKELAPGAQ